MLKVSIIIPVYKIEKYIERCIQSVIDQTYLGEIECIIVEDCSPAPDRSWELANLICEKYNGSIEFKLVQLEKNSGVSVARNVGINLATGDYVYLIDGDDYITKDCIHKLVSYVDKYPGVDLVQSNFTRVFDDGSTQSNTAYLFPENIKEFSDDRKWVMSNFISRSITIGTPWNMLIKRKMIIDNKIYFKEGLENGEDNLWVYMIGKYISSICICLDATYLYLKDRIDSAARIVKGIYFENNLRLVILKGYISNIDDYCAKPQIELIYRYIINLSAFGDSIFRQDLNKSIACYINYLNTLGRLLVWIIKHLPSSILRRRVIYNGFFLKLITMIHNYK